MNFNNINNNMNPMMMGGGMGMNPMMMGGNGMGMNPMMMGGMDMNQMMMGGGMGMNPMMMGGNGMGINPMMMGGGMNPMMGGGMGMNPMMMTPEQKEEWKKQQRYLGYLYGKKMAEQMKKNKAPQTPKTTTTTSSAPVTADTEITIKFKKGGDIEEIKMKADTMIAELINEYYSKTNNSGPFKYKGNTLKSDDSSTLLDNGMKDGDEIIVG